MSKNIWHTAKEKPMLHKDIILCGDGWSMPIDTMPETVNNICWKNVEKWCYVDDLIKENDHTRKALEIAKDTFNWIDETYRTGQDMEAEIWGKVQLAAQEITALEQKDK